MIEAVNLRKSFGANVAVNDVGFKVNPGEIVAFVGPNGAGKTTVLRMLSTFLPPDSGTAIVNGYDIKKDPLAVRLNIGYMPENSISYENMRVDRFLKFVGKARRLSGDDLNKQFNRVVETCSLQSVVHKKVGQCSKGYRRRVSLAMALIHDPAVLLLDEPTHGLDPLQVLALRDFIKSLKEGRSILFSSHIFQEVVAICDRVLIINNGILLADDTITGLALKAGRKPVLTCTADAPEDGVKQALAALEKGKLRLAAPGPDGLHVEMEATADGLREEVSAVFEKNNWKAKTIEMQPLNLEEIFAEILRGAGEEAPAYE